MKRSKFSEEQIIGILREQDAGAKTAEVFVGREAAEGLETPDKVVGCQEVGEVCSQMNVAVIVEALDGCLFDCAVHSFDLAVGPTVVWLGQPMLDTIRFADRVETHWRGVDGVPVSGLLGELDAIFFENGVAWIGHGFDHVLQELPRRLSVRSCNELRDGDGTRKLPLPLRSKRLNAALSARSSYPRPWPVSATSQPSWG
jgi:hypothetical protein